MRVRLAAALAAGMGEVFGVFVANSTANVGRRVRAPCPRAFAISTRAASAMCVRRARPQGPGSSTAPAPGALPAGRPVRRVPPAPWPMLPCAPAPRGPAWFAGRGLSRASVVHKRIVDAAAPCGVGIARPPNLIPESPASAWCTIQASGRSRPNPVSGSGGADVVRACELQHTIERVDSHLHLGRPALVLVGAQRIADHLLPASDGDLGQSARVVA